MTKKQHVRISKFLSYVLRHRPDSIGLELDEAGWASVDELIRCATAAGRPLTRKRLADIVATNDKQRFVLSEDGQRIRANQGHSIAVDLGLEPRRPPEVLYHGTATRFLELILRSGLRPGSRQYVHLSPDEETAVKVGQRHGRPVVLRVESGAMNADGCKFYMAANGVWLTERVPPQYLTTLDREQSARSKKGDQHDGP